MKITSLFNKNIFVVTGEVGPIKGTVSRDKNIHPNCVKEARFFHDYVHNVLLLTGDHIQLGDHKEAKPVFDLDSVQLIRMAAGLRNGKDIAGNAIENPPDMAHGAVVNPNFVPIELQLMKIDIRQSAFNWRLA